MTKITTAITFRFSANDCDHPVEGLRVPTMKGKFNGQGCLCGRSKAAMVSGENKAQTNKLSETIIPRTHKLRIKYPGNSANILEAS